MANGLKQAGDVISGLGAMFSPQVFAANQQRFQQEQQDALRQQREALDREMVGVKLGFDALGRIRDPAERKRLQTTLEAKIQRVQELGGPDLSELSQFVKPGAKRFNVGADLFEEDADGNIKLVKEARAKTPEGRTRQLLDQGVRTTGEQAELDELRIASAQGRREFEAEQDLTREQTRLARARTAAAGRESPRFGKSFAAIQEVARLKAKGDQMTPEEKMVVGLFEQINQRPQSDLAVLMQAMFGGQGGAMGAPSVMAPDVQAIGSVSDLENFIEANPGRRPEAQQRFDQIVDQMKRSPTGYNRRALAKFARDVGLNTNAID